jgi:hypothetical protein
VSRQEGKREARALKFFTGDNAPPAKRPEWLVEGFLARGAGTLLFGQPGVSKTAHTAVLMACLETGQDFAGLKVTGKGFKVLYVDLDSGWDWTSGLFTAAYRGMGIGRIPKTFYYYSPLTAACQEDGEDEFVVLETIGEDIARTVREEGIDLVIVDSLGQLIAGDMNSAQDVSLAFRLGLNPARKAGAAVLVLDHGTKASRMNTGSTPTPAGSQQKRAWARVSVAIEEDDFNGEPCKRWTVDKSNARHFEPFLTSLRFCNDHYGELDELLLERVGLAGDRQTDDPLKRVVARKKVLADLVENDELPRGHWPRINTYETVITALKGEECIVKGEGKFGRFRITDKGREEYQRTNPTSPANAPMHHPKGGGALVHSPNGTEATHQRNAPEENSDGAFSLEGVLDSELNAPDDGAFFEVPV